MLNNKQMENKMNKKENRLGTLYDYGFDYGYMEFQFKGSISPETMKKLFSTKEKGSIYPGMQFTKVRGTENTYWWTNAYLGNTSPKYYKITFEYDSFQITAPGDYWMSLTMQHMIERANSVLGGLLDAYETLGQDTDDLEDLVKAIA